MKPDPELKNKTFVFLYVLTSAPSSWKMAAAPSRSSGAIFLLQRLRRNESEERSFIWNFQPMRDENSQPSGSPLSCLCEQKLYDIYDIITINAPGYRLHQSF